jgi:HAD superfamily hydrolase (TIGR01509 family)
MYSGVIFDFDGVLYDSEKHWEDIENQYLLNHIPAWDPMNYKDLIGRSLEDAYEYLRNCGFNLTEDEYAADYHNMAVRLYSNFAKPLRNIDTLLCKLAVRKTKMAIASSSRRAWINIALQSNKLPVPIRIIVAGDDKYVAKAKPAPDVYLRVAKLLDEHTSRLIAIEDSKNGVASAKAAGLYCLGLRNGFNGTQDLNAADDVIDGYNTASITKIMGLIA